MDGFPVIAWFPVIIGSKEGLNYFPCFKYSFKVNVYLYAQSIFYFILFIINILLSVAYMSGTHQRGSATRRWELMIDV